MDTAQWPQEASLAVPPGGGRVNLPAGTERRIQPLNCPRCNSNNTKFCYYNNYSLSQPRHFCKTCRRYWTAGGSLRNVPVGGGTRKNKRSSAAAKPSGTTASSSSAHNLKFGEVQDLNVGFSDGATGLPQMERFSDVELLMPNEVYTAGVGIHDFRGRSNLGLGFSVGAVGGRGGQDGEERKAMYFPSTTELGLNRRQGGESPMFWNGMLGGGGNIW